MQVTFQKPKGIWKTVKRTNLTARHIADRHYSRKTKYARDFVGPGETQVLLTHDETALFVWQHSIRDDGQRGINCAIFRNEGKTLSSKLILEAEKKAFEKWPNIQRFFTFINPKKIKNNGHPGWCFIKAGWKRCGMSKINKLIILEKKVNYEKKKL